MGEKSKKEEMGWVRVEINDELIQEKSAIKSKRRHSQQIRQLLRRSIVHKNPWNPKKVNIQSELIQQISIKSKNSQIVSSRWQKSIDKMAPKTKIKLLGETEIVGIVSRQKERTREEVIGIKEGRS